MKINTAADIYLLVESLKEKSEKDGLSYLAAELDAALSLGSSGLEILGAIRNTFVENRPTIERLLGSTGKEQVEQVLAFVDQAFGR